MPAYEDQYVPQVGSSNAMQAPAIAPQAPISPPSTLPSKQQALTVNPSPSVTQVQVEQDGPWRLTIDQQKDLVKVLSSLSEKVFMSTIVSVPNDAESYEYASEFQRVFVRAGFKPSMSQQNPDNPSQLGLMIMTDQSTDANVLSGLKGALNKSKIAFSVVSRPSQKSGSQIILFIGPQPLN